MEEWSDSENIFTFYTAGCYSNFSTNRVVGEKSPVRYSACSSLQSCSSWYQLLHGEFPVLALPVDGSREKEGRGEPEAGAEGDEDHEDGFR